MIQYLAKAMLLISVLTQTVYAQTDVNQIWSPDFKIRGYERIVGVEDGNMYVQRCLNNHFDERNYESELARYDAKGTVTHIIQVENLEKQSYQELSVINTNMGIAVIYLTTDPKSDKYYLISAQLYDHNTLEPGDIVDLMKVRYRRPYKPSIGDYRTNASLIDIDIKADETKSKLAIFYSEERIGKDEYTMIQYGVYDLENSLAEVNKGTIETEKKSNKYTIESFALDQNGNTATLLKEYKDGRGLEFLNKVPGYRYSVYYEGIDSNNYIYDIPIKKYFVDAMMLTLDADGDIYVAGMLRKKPGNNVFGTITGKISQAGELLFMNEDLYRKSEIKKIRRKEKEKLEPSYEILDLRVSNTVLYALYQYDDIRQDRDFNNNPGLGFSRRNQFRDNFIEYSYKENLIVHGFELGTGDRAWTAVSRRKQADFDFYEYFTLGNIHLTSEGLTMLYNERVNNLLRIDDGKKPNLVRFPDRKTSVIQLNINAAGQLSDEVLSEESYYYIPTEGSYIDGNALYMLKIQNNLRRFNIGKVGL